MGLVYLKSLQQLLLPSRWSKHNAIATAVWPRPPAQNNRQLFCVEVKLAQNHFNSDFHKMCSSFSSQILNNSTKSSDKGNQQDGIIFAGNQRFATTYPFNFCWFINFFQHQHHALLRKYAGQPYVKKKVNKLWSVTWATCVSENWQNIKFKISTYWKSCLDWNINSIIQTFLS